MASKAANTAEVTETREEAAEAPLLDTIAVAIKKMVARGKERGYLTYDELNAALPQDQVSSEQIEDTMTMLAELGINVIESEESEEPAEAEAEDGEAEARGNVDDDDIGRTDDPVRMYLREMGSVELLSREGEIAVTKRIEAGREAMIAGLCESPLTFQAVIIWRDELNNGKVFLRDVIDLEATYAGPDAKAMPALSVPAAQPEGEAIVAATLAPPAVAAAPPAAPVGPTPFKPKEAGNGDGSRGEEAPLGEVEVDDDLENSPSLAAIEAELKPKVLVTFDKIAATYKRLRRLQDQDIESRLRNQSLSPAQERKYKKLKEELIAEVKSLHLNRTRIDSLIEQLYDINKRLVSYEGR